MAKSKVRNASNPLVYFDVSIGGDPAGRIIFELFKDVTPKVAFKPAIRIFIARELYLDWPSALRDMLTGLQYKNLL